MPFFKMPRMVRRFIRRKMTPIPEDVAIHKRNKLAIIYTILGWNLLGYVLYQLFYKGNISYKHKENLLTEKDEIRPAIRFAHVLGHSQATVYKFQGFKKIDEVQFKVDNTLPVEESYKILSDSKKVIKLEELLDD